MIFVKGVYANLLKNKGQEPHNKRLLLMTTTTLKFAFFLKKLVHILLNSEINHIYTLFPFYIEIILNLTLPTGVIIHC